MVQIDRDDEVGCESTHHQSHNVSPVPSAQVRMADTRHTCTSWALILPGSIAAAWGLASNYSVFVLFVLHLSEALLPTTSSSTKDPA